MKYYECEHGIIYNGHVTDCLAHIDGNSIHCVVTSPPYWQLRDYGIDGQIGIESTPSEYVSTITHVFMHVMRVLRDDGVLFLNIGDTYAKRNITDNGTCIKRGNKVGIPSRVMLSLQEHGWIVRSEIIWAKGASFGPYNGSVMPESVRNRPTKAHETLLMLTKSYNYWYNTAMAKEPASLATHCPKRQSQGSKTALNKQQQYVSGSGWADDKDKPYRPSMRKLRDVWTIPTTPFPDAHFAVFPEALVEKCLIMAVSPKGCCASCGAQFNPIVEQGDIDEDHSKSCGGQRAATYDGKDTKNYALGKAQSPSDVKRRILSNLRKTRIVGFRPSCQCTEGAMSVPCTVLDPFLGSGTVAVAAIKHGAHFIGIDLNADYCKIAENRINALLGLFA